MSKARIAAVSRQQECAGRRRRVNVYCDCGDSREVSYENYRRIERGEQSRKCGSCLGRVKPTPVAEVHLTYWLIEVGRVDPVQVETLTASGYIAEYGLPPAVAAIVRGF